jgi:hypothetical protein
MDIFRLANSKEFCGADRGAALCGILWLLSESVALGCADLAFPRPICGGILAATILVGLRVSGISYFDYGGVVGKRWPMDLWR